MTVVTEVVVVSVWCDDRVGGSGGDRGKCGGGGDGGGSCSTASGCVD